MRRREFITLLGSVPVSWPLAARAQQAQRERRIGVLEGQADDLHIKAHHAAFRQTLERLGWSQAGNVRIDYRFAHGRAEQAQVFAKELIALQPDVIFAAATPAAVALRRESRVIPIVFVGVSDPIGAGLVASLRRPGGNFTGVLNFETSITGKWLAMLKEIVPHLARTAFLANPKTTPYDYFLQAAVAAAASLAIELVPCPVENAADIERAIESFAHAPNGGLVVPPDTTTNAHRDLIIALAAQHRLPAVFNDRVFVAAGGLMSYATNRGDMYRLAASYVDRILRGDNPSELPVQTPTKFETAVNLKTAKKLGLTVPTSLLLAADEVIE